MVAGRFYPSDPKDLSRMIDKFFEMTDEMAFGDGLVGAIVPHAGYVYSGPVAAYIYKNLVGKKFDRVVIIAFSHQSPFPGVLVHDADVYRTPLGDAPIDTESAKKLLSKAGLFSSKSGSITSEHSGDVQVPFIQKALPGTPILSLIMGDSRPEISRKLAKALYEAFKGTNTLFIASSDLSHYRPYSDAYTLDSYTLSLILNGDPGEFIAGYVKKKGQLACGFGPIVTMMELFRLMGGGKIKVLNHATSGDVLIGNKDQVVGYASVSFTLDNPLKFKPDPREAKRDEKAADYLSAEEKAYLVKLARNTVETYVKENRIPEAAPPPKGVLTELGAAFVTLRKHGQLRGCIGHVIARGPLYLCVRDVAASAAKHDSRFRPVTLEELKDIDVEVSVLTPLKPVGNVEELVMGRHGVIVRKGQLNQGVYLPQVADETGWSRDEFLSNLCSSKARLKPDCWKDPLTQIFSFEAIVFE